MSFILFLILFLINFCFEKVNGDRYTKKEIDDAFKKYRSKSRLYVELDKHFGCWPNNIIPYEIEDTFKPDQVDNIHTNIRKIENRTCLRWIPFENVFNVTKYVKFIHSKNKNHCFFIEFGNETKILSTITLGDTCFPPNTESALHEMLHALGFTHEHQRIDRDCYVVVEDEAARTNNQFQIIYDHNPFHRWPYDKRSILHYRRIRGVLRDRDEPFGGLLWKYRLGDVHGWWGRGTQPGQLTYLDVYKMNYRFCGAPDFCDTRREVCDMIDADEYGIGCISDLLWDIALGKVLPSDEG